MGVDFLRNARLRSIEMLALAAQNRVGQKEVENSFILKIKLRVNLSASAFLDFERFNPLLSAFEILTY